MNTSKLRDLFRLEVDDTEAPYLWSDENEFFPYLDDAQKQLARLTGGIADTGGVVGTITLTTTPTEKVTLDSRILKVRAVFRRSDGRKIEVINYEDLEKHGVRLDGATGQAKYFITGMADGQAFLYPTNTVADEFVLLVDRMPLADITGPNQYLEVEPRHAIHLLDWVKHLAYNKQDSMTRDARKSAEHEAKFLRYCEWVSREKDRLKHKTRVVQYGGI